VFAVPSWTELSLRTESGLDLFTFSDAPILERIHLLRRQTWQGSA
jgi:gentisate 1,2-dioxygenase